MVCCLNHSGQSAEEAASEVALTDGLFWPFANRWLNQLQKLKRLIFLIFIPQTRDCKTTVQWTWQYKWNVESLRNVQECQGPLVFVMSGLCFYLQTSGDCGGESVTVRPPSPSGRPRKAFEKRTSHSPRKDADQMEQHVSEECRAPPRSGGSQLGAGVKLPSRKNTKNLRILIPPCSPGCWILCSVIVSRVRVLTWTFLSFFSSSHPLWNAGLSQPTLSAWPRHPSREVVEKLLRVLWDHSNKLFSWKQYIPMYYYSRVVCSLVKFCVRWHCFFPPLKEY